MSDETKVRSGKRVRKTTIEEPMNEMPIAAEPEVAAAAELPPLPEQAPYDAPAPEELNSLMSELGDDDHKVIVYRLNKEKRKFARLDEWTHKEFSLSMLGDTFGGGTYRVFIYRPNGQFVTSKVIEIDEAKRPKTDAAVAQLGNGMQITMPSSPAPDMSRFYELLMAQSAKNQEMVMSMMTKMAEAMGNIGKSAPQGGVFKEVGDVIAVMKMAESKGDPQVNRLNDFINVLERGMEVGAKASGVSSPSEDGNGFGSILKDILKGALSQPGAFQSIAQTLAAAATPPASPHGPQRTPPQPGASYLPQDPALLRPDHHTAAQRPAEAPVVPHDIKASEPAAQPETAIVETEMDVVFKQMKGNLLFPLYRNRVLAMAVAALEPKAAADNVLSRVPEDYYVVLNDFFVQPDFVDVLIRHVPEAAPHKEWLAAVVIELVARIKEYFGEEESVPEAPVAEEVIPNPPAQA